jgi:hypothetical protein
MGMATMIAPPILTNWRRVEVLAAFTRAPCG